MSTMEQVDQNLKSADLSAVGTMTHEEFRMIADVRKKFEERTPVPCTKCDYCAPCPNKVLISWLFELYNNGKIYDDPNGSRFAYNNFVPKDSRADSCIQCKICEDKCPQKIQISALMPKVHAVLGENKDYEK
jgi:predicted aldo/keto reductase-like oxidoreductase